MLKRYFVLAFLIIQAAVATSQMVYTVPSFPVNGQIIKVYFNTSLIPAGNAFRNYTGDVYVHTGVSIGTTSWQHVKGTWGLNSSQPKLTKVGQYLYELDITPDIKSFYGLGTTEVATAIDLVFRSSDATMQTSPDIFLTVYDLKLATSFTLPEKSSYVLRLNGKIPVKAVATLDDSVSLYINKKWRKRGSNPDYVTDTIVATSYGEFWVKSIAWSNNKSVADSFYFFVRKPVTIQALPDGLKDGINYLSNTSVSLVLQAPYKSNVFVNGDFTGWRPSEKGYMKVTPDGQRYWIQIDDLTPGKEYRYQYIVDSSLYIADPYTDKILDPDNDRYILPSTYPNLLKYPTDTASGILSVLQTAQVPYNWHITDFQPPKQSNLIIYELLIRDFVAKHDFKTLIDTLDYIDKLGINAIELMPVCEFEGNSSWGYNPSFYFAPDKYYGPKNDMKAFVDSCHARGIAVIMDIVLNHCMGQSPLVQLYLDHYGSDQIYMKLPNPWFNASSPNNAYKWGADFNHESPSTQALVDRVTSYWLTTFNVDGFRFDFSKGFTNTPGDGYAYDASRINILERIAAKIWSIKPKAYVILEHFSADAEERVLASYGAMLWNNKNYDYGQAAMGYSSDLTGASWLGRGWNTPNLVTYMESHDEERNMYRTITYGSSVSGYDTKQISTALDRAKLDAIFFLTLPGPRMIWQFGELGYDVSIDAGGRVSEKPIKWDYFDDTERHKVYEFYRILNYLKKDQEVFSTDNYSWSLNSSLKSIHLNGSSMCVNIIGNFGLTQAGIDPGFPNTGKWYEYFSGDSITVTNTNAQIMLLPGEYRMYSTVKLPSTRIILSTNDIQAPDPGIGVKAFPNPSSMEFSFEINNSIPSTVKLDIFDMTGRLIRQINEGILPEGKQVITWDGRCENGSDPGKGMYIARIRSSYKIQSIKLIRN